MYRLLLLAFFVFAGGTPASSAEALDASAALAAAIIATPPDGCLLPVSLTGVAVLLCAQDQPGEAALAADAVEQRRDVFVAAVGSGALPRFDDAKLAVGFQRKGVPASAHEPGPLEDEAIAAAARSALVSVHAKAGGKAALACAAGTIIVDALPDDPVQAAAVVDCLLGVDGVIAVQAALPPCLRRP